MDGFSAYNQIQMARKDAKKTAFKTPIENYYYTMIPFELKNASKTYQRTMTTIFHDMMHWKMKDSVNDIVVKSRRREDHVKELRKLFEKCILFKLRMNSLKWAFGVSAGKFLGFLVHNRGRHRPSQSSGNSNYEATSHSQRVEKFSRQGLLHQEVYPWFIINHFSFYKTTIEGIRLWIGGCTVESFSKAIANYAEPPHYSRSGL